MAPLNPVAMECMKEMQHECFKMGIPLNTRHREVAPNLYIYIGRDQPIRVRALTYIYI